MIELAKGLPNVIGDAVIFVMRVGADEIRLGIEYAQGSRPSATYVVGDVFEVDGIAWALREIVAPESTATQSDAPGTGSAQVVARIEAIGTPI